MCLTWFISTTNKSVCARLNFCVQLIAKPATMLSISVSAPAGKSSDVGVVALAPDCGFSKTVRSMDASGCPTQACQAHAKRPMGARRSNTCKEARP